MLSEDEKRALRQKQRLLYSSGQFPLGGSHSGGSRRARRPMSPVKALLIGVGVVLLVLVGLVLLLTNSARAQGVLDVAPRAGSGATKDGRGPTSSFARVGEGRSPSEVHSARAQGVLDVGAAALVAHEHDGQGEHAQQRRAE